MLRQDLFEIRFRTMWVSWFLRLVVVLVRKLFVSTSPLSMLIYTDSWNLFLKCENSRRHTDHTVKFIEERRDK